MPAEPITPDHLRPHDLLWIGGVGDLVCESTPPEWVLASLRRMPVVVVRRALWLDGLVPIGVRGPLRHQRFATAVPFAAITRWVPPERLILERRDPEPARRAAIPALHAFQNVLEVLGCINLIWGPTGSVGFELATGAPTATASSDLDLLLRATRAWSRPEARELLAALSGIDAVADIQLETPAGCIALREYCATGPAQPVLLRTCDGPRLVADPWSPEQGE